MHYENILKGIITTLIGALAMCAAFAGWFIGYLNNWEGGGLGIIGFMLLFMTDDIKTYVRKFGDALINKFSK
jgi:hypothetical protein